MVGASNAVNLTDGLDGLAIVPVMIAAACFALIAYLVGNAFFSDYLQLHYVPRRGRARRIQRRPGRRQPRVPVVQRTAGDGLHGRYRFFIGAAARLAPSAVITKHELVLVIIGGLFVLETVSVIVQVISFKLTGRRVFRMAPLHHHFETNGVGRANHRHPLLDHRLDLGVGRAFDIETEVREAVRR